MKASRLGPKQRSEAPNSLVQDSCMRDGQTASDACEKGTSTKRSDSGLPHVSRWMFTWNFFHLVGFELF